MKRQVAVVICGLVVFLIYSSPARTALFVTEQSPVATPTATATMASPMATPTNRPTPGSFETPTVTATPVVSMKRTNLRRMYLPLVRR